MINHLKTLSYHIFKSNHLKVDGLNKLYVKYPGDGTIYVLAYNSWNRIISVATPNKGLIHYYGIDEVLYNHAIRNLTCKNADKIK